VTDGTSADSRRLPRVVVITGADGGIGSAMCRAFEALGDQICPIDITDGIDITDPVRCGHVISDIISRHGRIDVLCNNAGVGAVGDILSTSDADWQRVMAVNLFGTVNMTRAVIPVMRQQFRGAIVNTCSVAADIGLVERVAYSASKGAVLALTRAVAADEVRHGIRVNALSPATVAGPWVQRLVAESADPAATRAALDARQPLGRMCTAEEVAAAAVYLAAPTTPLTGAELRLDAGMTGILPPRSS